MILLRNKPAWANCITLTNRKGIFQERKHRIHFLCLPSLSKGNVAIYPSSEQFSNPPTFCEETFLDLVGQQAFTIQHHSVQAAHRASPAYSKESSSLEISWGSSSPDNKHLVTSKTNGRHEVHSNCPKPYQNITFFGVMIIDVACIVHGVIVDICNRTFVWYMPSEVDISSRMLAASHRNYSTFFESKPLESWHGGRQTTSLGKWR